MIKAADSSNSGYLATMILIILLAMMMLMMIMMMIMLMMKMNFSTPVVKYRVYFTNCGAQFWLITGDRGIQYYNE